MLCRKMSAKNRKSSVVKTTDNSNKDMFPKRLTDENYKSIGAIEEETDSTEQQNEMEWFLSRIRRSKKTKEIKESAGKIETRRRVQIIEDATERMARRLKPGKLHLKLSESETIWILSITSKYSGEDVEDINRVKEDNEIYRKLTSGKALERKRSAAETQTPRSIEKSKCIMTTEIVKTDVSVNASVWDLYDTYAALAAKKNSKPSDDIVFEGKRRALRDEAVDGAISPDGQIQKLFAQDDFRYALLIAERLLASNCYQSKQSKFRKYPKSKYDIEPTTFTYEAHELWNYKRTSEESVPLPVAAMDWNPLHSDILAVGYGHLQMKGYQMGKVCVWSPKNPVHPEREYTFEHSVTAVSFSQIRPNILAVGCSSGNVYLVDISVYRGNIRMLKRDKIYSQHGPLWKIQWLTSKRGTKEKEELLCVGEGGTLTRFTFPDGIEIDSLLQLNYMSTVKTLYARSINKDLPNECKEISKITKVFVKHNLSGLWFSTPSEQNLCYISTKEGVILKVIVGNNCRIDDAFSAHLGPIYNIEHCPFTDLIYLTCSADWSLRIWMDGITEPLITLKMQDAVVAAKWSPCIATLIATVSGTDFFLWDIARNVFLPANVVRFEGHKFSNLLFSSKGTSVVLGDEAGIVRVLTLSQLPRQPFLQKEALVSAIERGLSNNKELLKKFKRFVEMNKKLLTTEIAV